MSKKERNILYRRLINSYLSSIISISLVLLLVGITGFLAVNAKAVSDYFKENLNISAILKVEVMDTESETLKSNIEEFPFVKEVEIVSREQGMKEMRELLGDDFLDVFEANPIPISLNIRINADYVSKDSLSVIEEILSEDPLVEEVSYQESVIDILNSNLERIGFVLAIFILLLLFISFVLINNTVRLNVYTRRFTIHTMRLVGATKGFIISPFIVQAAFQGLLSGLLSFIGLLGILYLIKEEFYQLFMLFELKSIIFVFTSVIVLGILICILSTIFVVNKLIGISKDELYY